MPYGFGKLNTKIPVIQLVSVEKYLIIYHRFIVRFPVGLDFLFITFLLQEGY